MKKILDHKTLFFVAALLYLAVPVLANEFQLTGEVPPRVPSQNESWSDKVKSGFNKFTKSVLPEKETPAKEDELSLSHKVKSSPELHVALAQSCEQRNETQNAIVEYEKALKLDPKHEDALLKYARFLDRIDQSPRAELLYRKAVDTYPKNARVHNHQGLFFMKHCRYTEAAQAFSTAIDLEPTKELYRGNLAVVLVDLGRYREAYKQLCMFQSSDKAYYNLGFLLQERGKKELAIKHFEAALRKNPNYQEARLWLANLTSRPEQPVESLASRPQLPSSSPPQQAPVVNTYQNRGVMDRQAGASPSTPPSPGAYHNTNLAQPSMQMPVQPSLQQPTQPPLQQPVPPSLQPPAQQPVAPQPGQQPVQPSVSQIWQPQLPPGTTAPVRTYSSYRNTIPPARQLPYVVPDPSLGGQSLLPQNTVPPSSDPRAVSLPSASESPTAIPQEKPLTLVAPSGSEIISRRLPPTSPRSTVTTSSDRYITPLPPVDWSNQFQGNR